MKTIRVQHLVFAALVCAMAFTTSLTQDWKITFSPGKSEPGKKTANESHSDATLHRSRTLSVARQDMASGRD
jgi:hypothetical protein